MVAFSSIFSVVLPLLKSNSFVPKTENLNPTRGLTFDLGKNFAFISVPNPTPPAEIDLY